MPNFLHSVRYAFQGLQQFFAKERNGKIQAALALLVITAGWYFQLTAIEWSVITVFLAMVLSLEMMNTAIEKICNLVKPEYHPAVKAIKDISAGAVWWAAMAAMVAALLIFGKYIRLQGWY